MKQWKRLFWGVSAILFAVVLAGCNGGNNNFNSVFAGTYTGAYAGTNAAGAAVSGRFTVAINTSGQVTGNLIAPDGSSQPVTGTIANDGTLRFATAAGANVVTIAGDLASQNQTIVGTGTFSQTVGGVQNSSSGRMAIVRKGTTNSAFTGNYLGTFTSTTPTGINGTVNVTIDADGAIAGTVNQTGTATVYSAAGVVTPDGDVTIFAVGDQGGQPRVQFIQTFAGGATTAGGVSTISGTFTTTQAGVNTAAGNFTLTEQ